LSKRQQPDAKAASAAPISAGILLYQQSADGLRVLLAHPGGPFFIHKDAGSWTIPKGLADRGEELADAARREFEEEVGWRPAGDLTPRGEVKLRSGKRVIAFAVQSDEPPEVLLARFAPGLFTMEWPRGSSD